MTFLSSAYARWFDHANGVNPSPAVRQWLTDRTSLTLKLTACSRHFRVQRLRQGRALCLADECAMIALPRRAFVQQREVLLRCDERPMVYAHTVVPLNSTASDWPFFGRLGERSLGATLFGDPRVQRGGLQFARLTAQHALVRRAVAAADGLRVASHQQLYARRCLFKRRNGLLLVTEVFLAAVADLRVVNEAHDGIVVPDSKMPCAMVA